MSQELIVTSQNGGLPTIPQQYAAVLKNFEQAFADAAGAGFPSIRFRNRQFVLSEANGAQILPDRILQVLILGIARDYHCVWYEQRFKDLNDKTPPRAVWWKSQGPPPEVPDWVTSTKKSGGEKHYSEKRRIVAALLRQDAQTQQAYVDLKRLYVADIGSMSLYNDIPNTYAFSLMGLLRFCEQHGINPIQFLTGIVFDESATVPSVRFIPCNENGRLVYLPQTLVEEACAVAIGPDVQRLLDVQVGFRADTPEAPQQPMQNAAPVQPVQPMQNAAPMQPMQNAAPMQPMQNAAPMQPMQNAAPIQPVQAAPPEATVQAVQTAAPVAPQPMQPVAAEASVMDAAAQAARAAAATLAQAPQAPLAPQTPASNDAVSAMDALLAEAGAYTK